MADDNCGIDPCAPGPGNVPVTEAQYMCSLGVRLQGTLDRARRINHRLGMRPYRVSLIWQERAPRRDWREVYRLDLTPVRVLDMTEVGRDLGESGNYANGSIRITEVSPVQVSENVLRGQMPPGVQWGADTHDREFFFEVQQYRRCAGDAEPPRHRFVLGSEVHHDGEQMFLSFVLVAQQVPRGDGGADRSIALKPPKGGTVIVT